MTAFKGLVQMASEVEAMDTVYACPVKAEGIVASGFKAIFSKKQNRAISIVSSRYCLMQSKEIMRNVVGALSKLGIHEVEGTIIEQNGRAFARVLLPKYISEGNSNKDIQLGFLLVNSYDRTKALSISGFAMRIVCTNGMVAPRTLGAAFVKKHYGNITAQVQEAVSQMIKTIVKNAPGLQAAIKAAMKEKYEAWKDMEKALEKVGYSKKSAKKILAKVRVPGKTATKWDLYNAITNYFTFKKMKETGRIASLRKAEDLLVAV